MKNICAVKNCKNKVVGAYTVDLDIKGLGYCKKHKEGVRGAILWLILGVHDMYEKALGRDDKKKKVTPKMKGKK